MTTSYHIRLRHDSQAFLRLTGITPEAFDSIYLELKPRYEARNEKSTLIILTVALPNLLTGNIPANKYIIYLVSRLLATLRRF